MNQYKCSFSYYCRDVKTADVVIKNGIVTTTPYMEEKLHLPFGFASDARVTRTTIDLFYARHVPPANRMNIKDILEYYGLTEYDEYELCRKTCGLAADHQY